MAACAAGASEAVSRAASASDASACAGCATAEGAVSTVDPALSAAGGGPSGLGGGAAAGASAVIVASGAGALAAAVSTVASAGGAGVSAGAASATAGAGASTTIGGAAGGTVGNAGAEGSAGRGGAAGDVASSSNSRCAPLKTSEQRPQRTQPSDTFNWSGTTRKTVPQAGQRVARLTASPSAGAASAAAGGPMPARSSGRLAEALDGGRAGVGRPFHAAATRSPVIRIQPSCASPTCNASQGA